ncbi:hypothetical protein HN51_069497 [Arachis hypogaea]
MVNFDYKDIIHSMSHDAHPMGVLVNFMSALSVHHRDANPALKNALGKFQAEEVYNFFQDDLLTEDILILDTHAEVFVWIGQSVDPKEKQNAFEIGQVQGNSFQKKVTLLFGIGHAVEDRLNGLNQGGPRQRAEALAALNSAFKSSSGTKSSSPKTTGRSQGSQRAAAVTALSQVLTAEKKKQSPDSSPVASRSPVVETSTSREKYSSYYLS